LFFARNNFARLTAEEVLADRTEFNVNVFTERGIKSREDKKKKQIEKQGKSLMRDHESHTTILLSDTSTRVTKSCLLS
jgi:hypothetical protein